MPVSAGLSFSLVQAVSFLTAMQGRKEMCPAQFAGERRLVVGSHGVRDDDFHAERREALES